MKLLFRGLTIAGAVCGTPAEMRDMLELAEREGIKPWVQTMPLDEANQALRDLEAGIPRYRLVLVNRKNS